MKTIVDLRKVAYAAFWYENQDGARRDRKPVASVHGVMIAPDEYAAIHSDYPFETNIERARRLDILDVWKPVIKLKFTTTRSLMFTGERAMSLWKSYNERIFGR